MAAKTEVQRLIFGGMVLTAPADKVPEGGSLILQNFRSDKNNQLMSRQGSAKRAGPIGSGRFHSLFRTNSDVYAGIGTSLYHGPTLGTTITGGLDGEPVGLAAYNNAVWLMNRNIRKRIVGAESYMWGVEAPQNAPSATGGGQLTSVFSEFTDAATVLVGAPPKKQADGEEDEPIEKIYAMEGGSPVENDYVKASFDGEDGTLLVDVFSATSVSCYVESGGTLTVDGQSKDEDVIRIKIFCSNPRSIESMTVFAKGGGGYVEFAIIDPPKFLNQGMESWTEVKIRRRLNLDDWAQRITVAGVDGNQQTISDLEAQFSTAIQTPTFVYTGSGWPHTGVGGAPPSSFPPSQAMLDMSWGSISKFGVSFKCKEGVSVGVGRVEAVGTVGENSSGAISYWYSYENIFGEDSNPSPASNAVIAGNQTITVAGLAASADPWVTTKKIFRAGGGLTQPLQVARVGNAVSSWEDLTTNARAQADNLTMPIDRDLPPAAKGVVGPIYGKLIAYNTNAHPARYFWTPAGQPWAFPGSSDDAIGNWEDAGSHDDEILLMTDHRPVTVIYKQRSIWRLVGDPETSSPTITNSKVSAFSSTCICKGGGVDYFAGPEGVFLFNMDNETKLSYDIDPIFKGDYVQLYDGTLLPPVSLDQADKSCISIIGDRLRFSYPEHGFSTPNVVLVYHTETGRWFREEYTNLPSKAFSAMLNEGAGTGGGRGFIAGQDGGYLYHLELSGHFLDDGLSARAVWQSRFFHQGLPHNNKVYLDLEIDCQTRLGSYPDSPLTVSIVYDDGTLVSLETISSGSADKPRFKHVFRLMSESGEEIGRTAKNYAVRVESDVLGLVVIFGVAMHWYPEEREARSFDSGPTNLGTEQVKQVDHVEFYLTASGQALRRQLHSDLPGNLLASRESIVFDAPNGRGTFRTRLDDIVEGRNLRLTISDAPSGSKFQVHQARVRMRTIGEYLDGSKGEYFESGEFSIAPGRVGELKDFLLDYDTSSAGGRIEIYSDLPSNAMTLRRTLALPARDRAPYVFPFEDPTLTAPSDSTTALPYGQLFKVRIYPPPTGVLRLHGRAMFRARLIGVYFDGSAGEIWETQPLDLLGGMGLFREVSIVAETGAAMTLEVSTELPGQTLAVVARVAVNTSLSGRKPVNARLPGNTKGRLQRFRLVGSTVARLLSMKVLARRTEINDTSWEWVNIPIEATANSFVELNMPVRQTPEVFSWVDLPVDSIE